MEEGGSFGDRQKFLAVIFNRFTSHTGTARAREPWE